MKLFLAMQVRVMAACMESHLHILGCTHLHSLVGRGMYAVLFSDGMGITNIYWGMSPVYDFPPYQ